MSLTTDIRSKSNPLRNAETMRQFTVGSYFLSFQVNKPNVEITDYPADINNQK
jgi:hypothetical protein